MIVFKINRRRIWLEGNRVVATTSVIIKSSTVRSVPIGHEKTFWQQTIKKQWEVCQAKARHSIVMIWRDFNTRLTQSLSTWKTQQRNTDKKKRGDTERGEQNPGQKWPRYLRRLQTNGRLDLCIEALLSATAFFTLLIQYSLFHNLLRHRFDSRHYWIAVILLQKRSSLSWLMREFRLVYGDNQSNH
jgi:hypothetical protein